MVHRPAPWLRGRGTSSLKPAAANTALRNGTSRQGSGSHIPGIPRAFGGGELRLPATNSPAGVEIMGNAIKQERGYQCSLLSTAKYSEKLHHYKIRKLLTLKAAPLPPSGTQRPWPTVRLHLPPVAAGWHTARSHILWGRRLTLLGIRKRPREGAAAHCTRPVGAGIVLEHPPMTYRTHL